MARQTDTRERLLHAAMELIWESSYGSAGVDLICSRAGVNKGSFYHFFESKTALAVAAIEVAWQGHRQKMDTFFSPLTPPLDRIRKEIQYGRELQQEKFEKTGRVCGCPLFSLGCEMGPQIPEIQEKVDSILTQYLVYYTSALEDAHQRGDVTAPNPAFLAQVIFDFMEGVITRARITNDLKVLDQMESGVMHILRVETTQLAA